MSFPLAFGPVYSRRLGWSLGVNLVPPKTCTWNCIYCYLGSSPPTVTRRRWVEPRQVLIAVKRVIAERGAPDYVTLVGVGEPTLAENIEEVISLLKQELGVRVAVLSNGSLFHRGVWFELAEADYVKATLTAVRDEVWRLIHEPAEPINVNEMIEGIIEASRGLPRGLHLEVMLVRGVNDDAENAYELASSIREARITAVDVNAPRSPPRLEWVEPPPPHRVVEYASILESMGLRVEVIAYRPVKPPRLDRRRPISSLLDVIEAHVVTVEEAMEALRAAGVSDPKAVLEKLVEEHLVEYRRVAGKVFLVKGSSQRR